MSDLKKKLLTRLLIFLGLSLLFGGGVLCGWHLNSRLRPSVITERHEGEAGLINPLLHYETEEDLFGREMAPFGNIFSEIIDKEMQAKRINSAAIYFRDMNNGPWIGINESEPFLPGSLLKIPVMMAYLKKAETDPKILTRKIRYESILPRSGHLIKPAFELKNGESYTVQELIYRMIVYSDNEATFLLQTSDEGDLYGRIYADLGIKVPDGLHQYWIDAKTYASFFRVLYNASYLNKEMSQRALELLSKADFHEGLVAGVPPDIAVAQKFGESKSREDQRQFHDCGIVYYPNRPYLLCVMTRGDDYKNLISFIRDVSKITFEEVDRQMKHGGLSEKAGR